MKGTKFFRRRALVLAAIATAGLAALSCDNGSSPSKNLVVDPKWDHPYLAAEDNGAGGWIITGFQTGKERASIEIPADCDQQPVASIADEAFKAKGLTSLTIQPQTALAIGNSAFEHNNLTSVDIPQGVVSIGNQAFNYNKLTNVIIAGSVKNIGEQAFYGIANNNNYTGPNMHGNRIASLTIANGVESIGNRAFHNNRLASIVIPGSVKRIGSQAFQYQWALLTSLTIENGVENIDTGAFRENGKLLSVTIPGSVKTIADYAFHAASGLRHVTLNEGLDSIGQYAFYGREIANITIPNSVTYIGDYAFQQTNLSTVHIGQGVLVNNGFPTGFRECYSSANDLAAGIYEKVNNNTWRKSE